MTRGTPDPATPAESAAPHPGLIRAAELLLCAAGLFVALWVLLNTALPGGTDTVFRIAGAATAAVMAWVFYPRRSSGRTRRRWLLARALILGAIVIASVVETESFNRHQSRRMRAVTIILAAQPYRKVVAARLGENPARTDPGRDMPVVPPKQGVQAHVAPDGTITMTGRWRDADPESGMRIVFTPRIDPATNEVTWTCRGEPLSWMPATCR